MIATIESVELKSGGTTVTTALAIGATVLPVDFTVDFDGTTLQVNDIVYGYSLVTEDTITLTSPLTVAVEENDPVWPLDAQGKREEHWVANVDLDDGGDSIPAEIPTNLISYFPEGDAAKGQMVDVELVDGSYRVTSRPRQQPSFDGSDVYVPRSATYWQSDLTISHATWTTLTTNWFFPDTVGDRIRFDGFTGRFIPEVDGRYEFKFGATFAANAVGARAIRFHVWGIPGDDLGPSRNVRVAADNVGTIAIETNQEIPLYAGMGVAIEVWQNSGGDLALKGSNVLGGATPLTDYTIRWVGPL